MDGCTKEEGWDEKKREGLEGGGGGEGEGEEEDTDRVRAVRRR